MSAPVRGTRAPTGGSSASLGDSALEPAAEEAAKSEDWPRAESLYRELARRQPRSAGAKRGLGVALMQQQKHDQAVTAFEDSLRLKEDAPTHLDLATCFAGLDRHPSALPHLRKVVQMSPRDPRGWTQLADALVKVDKLDAAAEALRESRKPCTRCAEDDGWNRVADDVARAATVKADKQAASGDSGGARKSLDVATALRPDLPEIHLAKGKMARAQGDNKAAAVSYRKAVEGFPDAKVESGASARLELAAVLLGSGDGAEAKKLAEQVVEVRGDDGAALDALGRACEATKDNACARKAYAKLIKLPANDATSKGAIEHARLRVKALKSRRR
ncbi:MAG: tetratricopeptide repeat protein [Bacteroidota bacterium]